MLETNVTPCNSKKLPPTVTTPLTKPPAGLQRTQSGTEEHAQFEVRGMRSTSGKFNHLLRGQEDGEVNDSLLGTELRTRKKDNQGINPEANGNHVSTQVSFSYLYLLESGRLHRAKLFY